MATAIKTKAQVDFDARCKEELIETLNRATELMGTLSMDSDSATESIAWGGHIAKVEQVLKYAK